MSTERLNEIRVNVLDRMERSERFVRLGMFGAALAEVMLLAVAFAMIDWSNRLERLLFLFSVLSYTIIVLGLVALGAHVTRTAGRVLAAMDPDGLS